jgi:hypothetical protein
MTAFRNSQIMRVQMAEMLIAKTEAFVAYRARFPRFVQSRSKSTWERSGKSIERNFNHRIGIDGTLSRHLQKDQG